MKRDFKENTEFMYSNVEYEADPKEEVLEAIEEFRQLPEEERAEYPLYVWLLGSDTEPYKIPQKTAQYRDYSNDEDKCSTCSFLYFRNADKVWTCSEIQGVVSEIGWCNRHSDNSLDESVMRLTEQGFNRMLANIVEYLKSKGLKTEYEHDDKGGMLVKVLNATVERVQNLLQAKKITLPKVFGDFGNVLISF